MLRDNDACKIISSSYALIGPSIFHYIVSFPKNMYSTLDIIEKTQFRLILIRL